MRSFKELMKIKEVKEALNQECEIDLAKESLTVVRYCDSDEKEYVEGLAKKAIQEGITKEKAIENLVSDLYEHYSELTDATYQMIEDSQEMGFISEEEADKLNDCVHLDFSEYTDYLTSVEVRTTCLLATKEDINNDLSRHEFINKHFKQLKKEWWFKEFDMCCIATQISVSLELLEKIQERKKVNIQGEGVIFKPWVGGGECETIDLNIEVKPCHIHLKAIGYSMDEVYGEEDAYPSKFEM